MTVKELAKEILSIKLSTGSKMRVRDAHIISKHILDNLVGRVNYNSIYKKLGTELGNSNPCQIYQTGTKTRLAKEISKLPVKITLRGEK